jgi:hypothetical protein
MSIADSDLLMIWLGKSRTIVLFVAESFKPIIIPPEENILAMFVIDASSLDAASFKKLKDRGVFGLLSQAIILRGIIEDRIDNAINFETRMFSPDAELQSYKIGKV